MLNKLKRSKKCKEASHSVKDQRRTAEVKTVVFLSAGETDTHGSDAAAAGGTSATKVALCPGQRETFRGKDTKIAPIFLHGKSKRGGKLDLPAEKRQKSVPPEDVQSSSTVSQLTERRGSSRGQVSPSALHSCLQEIQTSNPAFPVQAVFTTLQKRTCLQDPEKSQNVSSQQNQFKAKRERANASSEGLSKHLGLDHCHISAEECTAPMARKQPRSNKLSRTQRLRQQTGSPAGLKRCEPDPESMPTPNYNSSFEDVLWTDKYSPQHSSEVIGNCASVNKLQSWLKKWKQRAVCEERRKVEERRQEENSNDSWDCGDFQGEAGPQHDSGERLCNTMLITGPPGVGKTASVYACSQELGFKVFEVNCSSQRSGSHVLSQLKEATQSHLVETSGKDPLKPTYFNNYSSSPKETVPGKTVPPKNVPSVSKKRAAQTLGRSSRRGKANPAAVTLANYFKTKARADHSHSGGLTTSEKPAGKPSHSPSPACDHTVPQNKKTATSLILFEEVDVIFDDDVGFLAAIKTFMTTTKRPVILTTSDPSFRERFNCSLEEIVFKTPSAVNVCSYLQLVALAENVPVDLGDVGSLLRLCRGDVRRCLLQLQLWVHSGGGRKELTSAQHGRVSESGDNIDDRLPQWDTGCTASMLGLPSKTHQRLLNLLKSALWSQPDMINLVRLLAESWRGGAPLLYSNLELLLPIRAKGTGELASPSDLHIQQPGGNVNPKVPAVGNLSRLSRRQRVTTSDTSPSSSLSQAPQMTSSKRAHSKAQSLRGGAEQKAAKPAADCLDALTDFFDLMSYLDATLPAAAPLVSGSCRPGTFVWTGAEVKDGMLDEMSEEQGGGGSLSRDRLQDLQAAVEGLGCHGCLGRVSDAWSDAQKQRLGDAWWGELAESVTLVASSTGESLSFGFQPPCGQSVSQRRFGLSRAVLGSKSFSLLGNRGAVVVDYTPFLRSICRFQRAQRQKREPVRGLNYLGSMNLGLSKSTIQRLAQDSS